jgi:hypothetical protein
MKKASIFSLEIYKRTILGQLFFDLLSIICFIIGWLSIDLLFLLAISIFYTCLRSCHLLMVYVQIFKYEEYQQLVSLSFFASINIVWWYKGMDCVHTYLVFST